MSKNEISLNSKIEKLNSAIEWFYSDSFSLDLATENYQKALSLAKEIENDLNNIKNTIEVLSHDFSKE